MMTAQKLPARSKILHLALTCLLITVGAVVFVMRQNDTPVLEDTKGKTAGQDKPVFSFTGSGEWRQGPTNGTSMALFSPSLPDGTRACFTSTEYYKGKIDIAAALQKNRDMLVGGGYDITFLGSQTLTLQTGEGGRQYELHQSKVETPSGAMEVKGGNELGYLQLSEGYIKILGNCNTADELASTLPALAAVRYSGKL